MNHKTSPIGLFRRGITAPKQLVATSIARHHLVDDLLDKLKRRVNKKSGQNHLYIGPRGIGKTHLLSLIQYGIESDTKLHQHYSVIRFPEESNRVLSFADLLLGVLDMLAEVDSDPQWRELHNEIATEDDDNLIIDSILPRLKHWHKQSGKVLLIMMENLDVIFTQQIKNKQDIHRFRSLLMDNSHIVLIGTAPIFFSALNDVKHPLYDFFDIQVIDELDQEQTLSLIKTHLEWDNNQELLLQFEQLKPRILAMHTLTGGNPRLIMMLYELISKDKLLETKTHFQQLLDRITPFYQDRLKDLPPQERALLETIALMRVTQRTPVQIAKVFRKPRHQTSTLLKRMTDAGYLSVSANPNDKRSRLYRIKEGFFDIWLAMNESRAQRKYLPYLVDFFTLWYASLADRESKRRQLTDEIATLQGKEQDNALETLNYLSEAASDTDEKYQSKMEVVVQQLKLGHNQQAQTLLQESQTLNIAKPQRLMTWMHDQASHWSNENQPENALSQMEKVIALWQQQRSGDLENIARIFHELHLDFSEHGLHQLNIALLQDELSKTEESEEKIQLLLKIAACEKMDGQLSTALETLNIALPLTKKIDSRQLEGTTLNNMATIVLARGDYETALSYLNQSLTIRQNIGDKAGEGATLSNISQIYDARGDYETALSYLNQSLTIMQDIGNKAGEGTTLNNISQIFKARGDYETALSYLNQSLTIIQDIGDKASEGTTLNNISQIYDARGDYETALSYLNQSLTIAQDMGDKAGEGTTLNNISQIFKARGDYETALAYLNQSLTIRQDIGDIAGLCISLFNMGHMHRQNNEPQAAMQAWLSAYKIAKKINLAKVLNALEALASDLGFENGLESWEELEK